ncbi:exodeoxyribonuclease VII large subunit [Nioella sp. MMSF_3534]|uniref:exodeoxyribonuclease VII large subunit n=1 Tax=Nioella sp. MMSF_3534 TaxID=3046720 RepID=UPI00273D18D8|nr:exodeoxyribonuclease VII large subunit [Nioella sp. MMSF_3534]
MTDLLEDDAPGNAPEFTVSEISGAVKRTIEGSFSHLRVRGEVGRLSRPRSGHVYLDLKDDRSVLASVIWKGVSARLATQPEEGMEVIATGRLTTFPGQSKYQLVIEDIRPAGMGALMAMLEKRKAALAAEGLFDEARKQKLPFLPEVIGVVTSPSGAVIRDILHRLRDRFPRKVLIWPVAVQGAKCAPEVAAAIRGFNAFPAGRLPRPDLLIVARGGGSLEDLWGFNEEAVVRAAAESAIPLISAVGHETDTTLIDYASDRRAPTPTAAAEMAVPVRLDLLNWVGDQGARATRAATQTVALRRQRLGDLARGLPRPEALVEAARQRLDYLGAGLDPALRALAREKRMRLEAQAARLAPALDRGVATRRVALGRAEAGLSPARLGAGVRQRREALDRLAARMSPERLADRTARDRQRFEDLSTRFARLAEQGVAQKRDRLAALERLRQTLGYTETLKRGYAVVRAGASVLTTREVAQAHARLEVEFADGRLGVMTESGPARGKRGGGKDEPEQGSLF